MEDENIANKPNSYDTLKSCVSELIKSVNRPYYFRTCSISIVPEKLKEWNEDAYMPKVVSIGPRFRGAREDLLLMEKIKLQCMSSLLHRSNEMEVEESLEKCIGAVWELDEKVRACYVDDIKLSRHELAKIMLVDGCFLLELLISNDCRLNHELKSISMSLPGPEVVKHELVLSDLILLENQIPIFVLHELSQILFPNEFTNNRDQRVTRINDLALCLLGYSPFWDPRSPHFLDLVHSSINLRDDKVEQVVIQIEETQHLSHAVQSHVKPKLKRCATRLQAAGITIKSYTLPSLKKRNFDFDIKFSDGILGISQLHITETTKAMWCNIIAWEHHKRNWWSLSNAEASPCPSYSKVTFSALFFNGLVCCAADFQLLKDKNIIVDHLDMSHEEVKAFFRSISMGVDDEIIGSGYAQMFHELNNYSGASPVIQICKIWWHIFIPYFIYQIQKLINFMKTDYHFVAAVLAALAIPQTVYAVLAYYHH